jgi:hypothetical protein
VIPPSLILSLQACTDISSMEEFYYFSLAVSPHKSLNFDWQSRRFRTPGSSPDIDLRNSTVSATSPSPHKSLIFEGNRNDVCPLETLFQHKVRSVLPQSSYFEMVCFCVNRVIHT